MLGSALLQFGRVVSPPREPHPGTLAVDVIVFCLAAVRQYAGISGHGTQRPAPHRCHPTRHGRHRFLDDSRHLLVA